MCYKPTRMYVKKSAQGARKVILGAVVALDGGSTKMKKTNGVRDLDFDLQNEIKVQRSPNFNCHISGTCQHSIKTFSVLSSAPKLL